MRRRLAFGALALLLPIAIILALLFSGTSTGPLTPLIENQVSRLLGRELRFGEPPRIKLGSSILLDVADVSLADTTPDAAPMLKLAAGHVALRTRSLLEGPLEIENLLLQDVKLALHIDEDGRSNLPELLQRSDEEASEEDEEPIPVRLASGRLEQAEVHITDARDGREATLLIESVRQEGRTSQAATLSGRGEFQGRPWDLDLRLSSPQPLRERGSISAELRAAVADFRVEGRANAPSAKTFADLELALSAEGTLPAEITDLSPLLEAGTPISLQLQAADTDPGIDIDLDMRLPHSSLQASGHIGLPAAFDGVQLSFAATSDNVDRILAAFHLPTLDGQAIRASGKIERDGYRLGLSGLEASVGEHHLRGNALFPEFPDPKDAGAEITISGPDFSIYPRLAGMAPVMAQPYAASFVLLERNGPELVDAELTIGQHEITLDGPLGSLPSFVGSRLEMALNGPDLTPLAVALRRDIPQSDYRGSLDVSVEEDGSIRLHSAAVKAFSASLTATGTWGGAPDFAGGTLYIDVSSPSLGESAQHLDLQRLGDLPAKLSATVSGSVTALSLGDIKLESPALSVAQTGGALNIDRAGTRSDLQLEVSLTDLRALLGDYASDWEQKNPITFTLGAVLQEKRLRFDFEGMRSGGVTGAAHFAIGTDFDFNAATEIDADLRIENPARLLPGFPNIKIRENPVTLNAQTDWAGSRPTIEFRLAGAGQTTVGGNFTPAVGNTDEALLNLIGEAGDIREVVAMPLLPPTTLPLSIDTRIRLRPDAVEADIRELSLAGTTMHGNFSTTKDGRSIRADIDVPEARLQPWLDHFESLKEPADAAAKTEDKQRKDRLIPDTPLPLEALQERELALSLRTGPLGISDPFAPAESLVERSAITLDLADGVLVASVSELAGSRGTGKGELHVNASRPVPEVALTMAMRDLRLALISRAPTLDQAPRQDVDLNLRSRGLTYRDLAANLDGDFLLVGGKGVVEDTSLSFVTDSFIQQLVLTLMPMLDQRTDVQVECAVVAARASSGIVSLDPGFVFRTKRVDLSARGEIDLQNERLRIRFDNQARKGLGISAASIVNPYVQITGTLARPTLGLDVANSAVAGGAAVATGGLTVIAKPLLGRIFKRENPCEAAVAAWKKSQESP